MIDFKCMLAKPLVEKRVKYPCLVSPKLDGIRAVFHNGQLYTRNKNVIQGVGHILEILNAAGIESLDGELMIPGVPFQVSSGKIRSYNDTPEAVYYIFDIPASMDDQRFRLETLNHMFGEGQLLGCDHVQLVPHLIAKNLEDVYEAYNGYRLHGYEGTMVKCPHSMYVNTRSAAWQKIKAKVTYDCKVIGFFEGQGRLTDTLGGIIVDFNEVPVRVGGGFTDAERDEIWNNQDKYMGAYSEVEAQEVTPDGSLRHPRHVTWRWDI